MTIRGIDDAESLADVVVFQAGTSQGPGADPLVSGGRVLAVTALGKSLGEAARRAYEGAAKIAFDGMHYRKDIARDAVRALAARPAAGA
jgi:phosphoribosylamine-glycine ligase